MVIMDSVVCRMESLRFRGLLALQLVLYLATCKAHHSAKISQRIGQHIGEHRFSPKTLQIVHTKAQGGCQASETQFYVSYAFRGIANHSMLKCWRLVSICKFVVDTESWVAGFQPEPRV